MASVTFPTNLGGSGATISDDADPNTGLANGGHRTRFIPALQGTIDMALYVYQYADKIDNSAADADRAENARGYVEAVADQYQVNILEQFKNKATLVSDFANQEFRLYDGLRKNDMSDTSLWTITRATTGTYVDATGKIREAAIDEPRYTYNPDTGESLGITAEGSSTNYLLHSQDFSQSAWTKDGTSVSVASDQIAPIVGGSVYKLSEDTSSGIHDIGQAYSLTMRNTVYFIVKPDERFVLTLAVIDVNGSTNYMKGFNLQTEQVNGGLVGGPDEAVDFIFERLSFGFYKVGVKANSDLNGTGARVRLYLSADGESSSYTGDGSSGIYIAAAQAENTNFTSYIKTSASTVTRAEDVVERQTDKEINPREGTLILNYNNAIQGGLVLAETTTTGSDRIRLINDRLSFGEGFLDVNFSPSASACLAVTYSYGTAVVAKDGVIIGNTSCAQQYDITAIRLGMSVSSTFPANPNSYFFHYIPNALTAAELETLTAI